MRMLSTSLWILLVVALLPLQGCATAYSATALDARLVDADTKQPIEAANVVAHWVIHFGLEGGQGTDLELMETLTDPDGRFHFPAWGPKAVPRDLPWYASMQYKDPQLLFFKSGYLPRAVSSEIKGSQPGPGALVRSSEWNGKTIELKKANDDRVYAATVSSLVMGVSWGGCGWKRIPRMLVALHREGKRLSSLGVAHTIPTMREVVNTSEGKNCGDVQEFFKAYDR